MIVRDEADTLPAALASLADAVDEVVVVDTGSRDDTPEIARRAGARVLDFVWCDDFAAARNVSLEAARGTWCLVLDADETVADETWPALQSFFDRGASALGRVVIASETADGTVREQVVRVCRGGGCARFEGRIHEQLVGEGLPIDTGLLLRHTGYTDAMVAGRDKLARNERLLRAACAEAPEDAFLAWQLGRTLVKRGGDALDEAVGMLRKALDRESGDAPWVAGAARDLGYALRDLGEVRAALGHVTSARRRHPRFTDLAFLEGLLHLDLGDAGRMRRAFESCLRLGEPQDYPSVDGVGSFRARTNLGLVCELSGDSIGARAHYEAAVAERPDFAPARERLAVLPVRARVSRLTPGRREA
jgi:tetratricopeptide (TPR) repeat protein